MYPHERSLVKRFRNKPFVILGVNSDANREQLRKTVKEERLSWRSWWDGGSTSGPIATTWNVSAWPTVYILDQKGVIRGKQVHGASLDRLLERLVAEAEE